ncbi:MAG: hypothetical protein SGARI_001109, partial [Bacillariaceae sp.]
MRGYRNKSRNTVKSSDTRRCEESETKSDDEEAKNNKEEETKIDAIDAIPKGVNASCVRLNGQQIMSLGLDFAGFRGRQERVSFKLNVARFRSFYGVGPDALSCMWCDIIDLDLSKKKLDAATFLMAMNWLKLYDTEHVLAGRWLQDEKTIRNKICDMVLTIQKLKASKVVWEKFDEGEVFVISVDGVHCRIREVRTDPGSKWYDHKSHGAGVSYELGIAIRSGKLVWMKGPFPASQHDMTTFRGGKKDDKNKDPNSLMNKLEGKQLGVGDSGYKGEPTKITYTRPGDAPEVKEFKARV